MHTLRAKLNTTYKGTTILGNMQQFHKKGAVLAFKKAFCKVQFTYQTIKRLEVVTCRSMKILSTY